MAAAAEKEPRECPSLESFRHLARWVRQLKNNQTRAISMLIYSVEFKSSRQPPICTQTPVRARNQLESKSIARCNCSLIRALWTRFGGVGPGQVLVVSNLNLIDNLGLVWSGLNLLRATCGRKKFFPFGRQEISAPLEEPLRASLQRRTNANHQRQSIIEFSFDPNRMPISSWFNTRLVLVEIK